MYLVSSHETRDETIDMQVTHKIYDIHRAMSSDSQSEHRSEEKTKKKSGSSPLSVRDDVINEVTGFTMLGMKHFRMNI